MSDGRAVDPRFTGTQEVREQHRFELWRLERYLTEHLDGYRGPLEVSEFRGGQSCPTYELKTGAGRFVLCPQSRWGSSCPRRTPSIASIA